MNYGMTDFEIIESALTGWDEPEPPEMPLAREALNRVKALSCNAAIAERERIIAILTTPQPHRPERMQPNQRISTSGVDGFRLNESFLRAVIEP